MPKSQLTNAPAEEMRLDKFLKVSRLIKRRTVAGEACEEGHVMVGGREVKPSHRVRPGDILDISFGSRHLRVRVLSVRENPRREESSSLYEVLADDQRL